MSVQVFHIPGHLMLAAHKTGSEIVSPGRSEPVERSMFRKLVKESKLPCRIQTHSGDEQVILSHRLKLLSL